MAATRQRGSLHLRRLLDMLGLWVQWRVHAFYVFALALLYVFGLRWGELTSLPEPPAVAEGSLCLVVPPQKQWHHSTLASVPMGLVPAADLLPVLVAAGFPFDGPPSLAVSHPVHAALVSVLRSAGCQAEINQLIQRAAQTLSWPSQGVFYSTHSAKHGRAFDLRVKYQESLPRIMELLRLRGKGTALLYSTPATPSDLAV